MRIAFVGKGGSGKTTLSALTAKALASRGYAVLAIDADINQHLSQELLFPHPRTSLSTALPQLKEYIRGTNPHIASAEDIIKTTPPGNGSGFFTFTHPATVLSACTSESGKLRLMEVGLQDDEDTGTHCYHARTGSVELFLNHLLDQRDEYVVVDMTAGADAFASGLFTRFDVTFAVVEPTEKSLQVFLQYKERAKNFGIVLKALGNKVAGDTDDAYLRKHLKDDFLTSFPLLSATREDTRAWNGNKGSLATAEDTDPFTIIESFLKSQDRDWPRLQQQAIWFHKKNATRWANKERGIDVQEQIDPSFMPSEIWAKAYRDRL